MKKDIVGRIKLAIDIIEKFNPWNGNVWVNSDSLKNSLVYGLNRQDEFISKSFTAKCLSCKVMVDLESARLATDIFGKFIVLEPLVVVNSRTFSLLYFCGGVDCLEPLLKRYIEDLAILKCHTPGPLPKNVDICDFCRELTNSPHRCSSCKCKLYCSIECQQQDWEVHVKMCNLYQKLDHKSVTTRNVYASSFNDNGEYVEVYGCNLNRYKK